jgi:hypothetical protein
MKTNAIDKRQAKNNAFYKTSFVLLLSSAVGNGKRMQSVANIVKSNHGNIFKTM